MGRTHKKIVLIVLGLASILLLGVYSLYMSMASADITRIGIVGVGEWEPEHFVNMAERPGATADFQEPPDLTRAGRQRIRVDVTYADGSRSRVNAQLQLLQLVEPLQLEVGQDLTAHALFAERGLGDIVSSGPEFEPITSLGEQEIQIWLDGRYYTLNVIMADTIAPQAVMRDVNSYVGAVLEPADFIEEIIDATQVTAEFIATPDTSVFQSTNTVEIVLTDEGNNRTVVSAQLSIVEQEELPVIYGVRDIHVGRGATIAFRQGVTVTHSAGEATLEIDSSAVNTNEPGTYEVIYIARSPAGQETRVTIQVMVGSASEEDALALVQPVLDEIIVPGMSNTRQAQAVHDWVRTNIAYNNTGARGSVIDVVYQGMSVRRGDCFTYYALSRFMLEQLGFETISVERYPVVQLRHYWLLVDLGDGFHHFDATRLIHPAPRYGFMMTAAEVEEFNPWDWPHSFYSFDPNSLPPGVEVVR